MRGWSFVIISIIAVGAALAADGGVELAVNEAGRRVDVTVDGKPFTSYIWPSNVAKPVLFPIRSAKGIVITRGRAGFQVGGTAGELRRNERADHPHHVGLWLNYGDVGGYDFWGNSYAIPEAQRSKEGSIIQRAITKTTSGTEGVLEIDADWTIPDGTVLLKEHTRFVFGGTATTRTIDRTTTLTAGDRPVPFPDTKEGMFGLRVARSLEMPSKEPEVFTDASGHPTAVPKLDNTGVTGDYLTSEGKTGDAAWGTPAKWCRLSGKIDDAPVSIAMFDAPQNPGYPTHWHARPYGLFSANPFGVKDFTLGKETLNFSIAAKQSTTFHYRVLIIDGAPTAAETEAAWKAWSNAK